MALIRRQFVAVWLTISLGLMNVASADYAGAIVPTGYTLVGETDLSHHLNSFAMIFGRCVWIPPSPKAALAAFNLFVGIATRTEPDIATVEAIIISQYTAAGKSKADADKEVAWLNSCFATYEVPPEKRNHPTEPGVA